ncbi:ABC transporter substrate-binding protein [Bacillus chungangensis]|uniref:Iron complex transport system substrate-binding protein n=1 Tax=Bacillus chungangensis TaxID=587633 RepID=A0ABT9WTR0_9BACI|nr:ABC transporter substrate-binding protein [Bacillus chungangensis]MDQ0176508.1 iron complex transport system substrate-binding protein [Bacillus chungangensis]
MQLRTKSFACAIISVLLLSACTGKKEETPENASPKKEEMLEETKEMNAFPRNIQIGDKTISIPEKPTKIAPLSLDVAEIVLELVDESKVVAISSSIADPYLSTQSEKAANIENNIASATSIDPEQVLSYKTDLLLLTKLHGQEEDADQVLSQAGIPILSFDKMETVKQFQDNLFIIGQAIGEEEKANTLVEEMNNRMAEIQKQIPTDAEKPTVLVLSEVGPGTGPYMMAAGNISYDIIHLAGGAPAVDTIGLDRSTKASVEQVIKMDPDYIVLLDWAGRGEETYKDLIETPGWSTLQAVKNDQLKVLEVKYLLNPNTKVIDGLEILTNWIYPAKE